MNQRYRAIVLVFVLAVIAGAPALPALAQEALDGPPACPLTEGIVLNAQGEAWNVWFLRSDQDAAAATAGPGAAVVPAGTYTVVLAAWDRHDAGSETQANEQWALVGLDGAGAVVFTSGATPDIADDQRLVVATVDGAVEIAGFVQAAAVHAAFPNTASPNSVWPLCASFVSVPDEVAVPEADLGVAVTMPDVSLNLGSEQAVFDVVVTNNGPDGGEAVVAVNALPEGFTLVSATSVAGTCSDTAGVISCDLGSLASGESATIAVVAEPSTFGAFVFGVTVGSTTADPDLSNNAAEVAFNVVDVLPQIVTTTTSAPPETLPFTGASPSGTGGLAAGLILMGGLAVLVGSSRLWYRGKHR